MPEGLSSRVLQDIGQSDGPSEDATGTAISAVARRLPDRGNLRHMRLALCLQRCGRRFMVFLSNSRMGHKPHPCIM